MSTEDESTQKIRTLIEKLVKSPDWQVRLDSILADNGFRMLRQVETTPFPTVTDPDRLARARHGVILDSETTGVDVTKDKVIQASMLRFTYDEDGILALGAVFDRYNDPGIPIPAEVTSITGITDEMVAGKKIEDRELQQFLEGVDIVVAHNADFDRKMMERNFPGAGFQDMAWHCSIAQVDWKARGENNKTLELLALHAGYVYQAHNALSDITTTAYVINSRLGDGPTVFTEMLANGSQDKIMLLAADIKFGHNDTLKAGGFLWSGDIGESTFGVKKVWHKTLKDDPAALAEAAELLRKVYGKDVSINSFRIGATERYSMRRPPREELFRTAEVVRMRDALDQAIHEPIQPMLI
ncbi:hypothetical protein LAZ40_11720 [Cereibacter sphaeroides]|uniref:3'-5' exonuclease n=1 Tax=Cereibacter sphaeroides TaxID=1063 RepID=UPI001EEE79EE|nr:3'-5' exonuclease [Cereibacter sphaeroides]MCE6959687.1 hypothetical protein [Cereibacter sphaeroides]MCE6974452.1 hypothetical protein [Cereibacter sphaeroides]